MLRKALKISKTVVKVFSLAVFVMCAFYANGEEQISMPSSPAMPSVSVPQISNGFYVPGSSDFYSGQKSTASGSSSFSSSGNSTATQTTNTQATDSQSAQNITSLANSLTESLTQSENSLINSSDSSLNSSLNNSLNSALILNSLSGLLKGKTNTDQIFSTSAQTLEQAAKSAQNESLVQAGQSGQSSAQNSVSPSILRFLINGTDMIPFCKTVFFSSAETDGSFLLTGDCRYELNGSVRNETFYLLFRSKGSKNAVQEFSVTASVFQNVKDSSTYLYSLTKSGNLTAQKTGNLISLKSNENGTNLNMLLSF